MWTKIRKGIKEPEAALHYVYGRIDHPLLRSGIQYFRQSEPLIHQVKFDDSVGDWKNPSYRNYLKQKTSDDEPKPDSARHYDPDSWENMNFEIKGEEVICSVNSAPVSEDQQQNSTVCLIPYKDKKITKKPWILKENSNTLSKWMDRLVSKNCSILLVHGKWLDDLAEAAELVRQGYNPFERVDRRIDTTIEMYTQTHPDWCGHIVTLASSRYGWSVLNALSDNDEVSGVVAHQPITWWPYMDEFSTIDYRNSIIQENSLFTEIDAMAPNPILLQTGYMDNRVGQFNFDQLSTALADKYKEEGASECFEHETMSIPGHSGWVPDSSFDNIIDWMQRQGFA